MSIETISQWMRDYGVADFAGACAFTYRDAIDFTIETSADESHLIMHSVLAEIAEDTEAKDLRRLLQMNYLGKETSGATLALDETGVNVMLWIALPIASLDVEQFEQVIGSFLDLSEQLSEKIRADQARR